jgi:hypothetical protein
MRHQVIRCASLAAIENPTTTTSVLSLITRPSFLYQGDDAEVAEQAHAALQDLRHHLQLRAGQEPRHARAHRGELPEQVEERLPAMMMMMMMMMMVVMVIMMILMIMMMIMVMIMMIMIMASHRSIARMTKRLTDE